MKIKTCDNKGFHITCSDGVCFSVQFGPGNYCENRHNNIAFSYKHKPDTESSDCEMAVFDSKGKWATQEFLQEAYDDVLGHVPLKKALCIILAHEEKALANNNLDKTT